MTSAGPAAEAARAAFREHLAARGHFVDNARSAVAGLEAALAAGALQRTPALDLMLADLAAALDTGGEAGLGSDPGPGEARPGGKSAEAARLILRAISRELDRA